MEVLYARQEHGGFPIYRKRQQIEVLWPTGKRTYKSVRKTILAITNQDPDLTSCNPKHFNYCWDRYFRLGKYKKSMEVGTDTLSLFGCTKLTTITSKRRNSRQITVVPQALQKGIDLGKRGIEVRKLFYKGFSNKVLALGYDLEDVLQEVYLGILQRNRTKGCFDPERSAFSSYVYMVCGCVISNYKRKNGKFSNEICGTFDANGDNIDVSESNLVVFHDTNVDIKLLKENFYDLLVRKCKNQKKYPLSKIKEVLPLVLSGFKNTEICRLTGHTQNWVSSFVKHTKTLLLEFVG